MRRHFALVAFFVMACSGPTSTATPTALPTDRPTTQATATPTASTSATPVGGGQPPACGDAMLLYEESIGLILANCVDQRAGQTTEEVWAWSEAGWRLVDGNGPPSTVVAGVALDTDRQVLVRYGGLPMDSNECAAETWEWSAVDGWAEMDVAESRPTACDHTKLVYDAAREVTVLVGGGVLQALADETWTWDGTAWSQAADEGIPAPAPRAHHELVYDATHEQTFLYGGYDGELVFDDFWSWDGSAWTALDVTGPGPRSHAGMAAGPEALLLFGGATGPSTFATLVADTWLLTDGSWQQIEVVGPSPRGSPALAHEPVSDTWLLYGGFAEDGSELADTWRFDGTVWECLGGC